MKRHLIISILLLLIASAVVWFWSPKPTPPVSASETAKPEQSQTATPITQEAESPQRNWINNAREQLPAVDPQKYDPTLPQWEEWRRRNKEDQFWEWKMPINFYGKVVEYTTGEPIPNVEIRLSLTDLSSDGTSEKVVYSNSLGIFELSGATGKKLLVRELKKDGYIRSRVGTQLGFEYAAFFDERYHQPDPNNPVIFRMKKKGVAEPLVHRETLYGLKPDGTPNYLNLRTGRKNEGGTPSGDLMLQLTRTDSSDPRRPNWTLTIQGMGNTGLLESSEEFMFGAPASGYVNQVRVEQQGNASDYQSQVHKNYYVRLDDGKIFARIETRIFSKYNEVAAINIALYLNPSGSRNLEYDPEKTLK